MSDFEQKDDKRIEELQVKVAFLEESLTNLSDEYYIQQKELDTLKNQYAILAERMKGQSNEEGASSAEVDERPPHY